MYPTAKQPARLAAGAVRREARIGITCEGEGRGGPSPREGGQPAPRSAPQEARGPDGSLKTPAQQPYGAWILAAKPPATGFDVPDGRPEAPDGLKARVPLPGAAVLVEFRYLPWKEAR